MLRELPFYYLRHGQTDWNREHRAQGQKDIPLNETGRLQAESAVSKLAQVRISSICSSPLKRARETADIIASALGLPVIEIDALKEASWGVCEGQQKGVWFSSWRNGITPVGAEPYNSFVQRALIGINSALEHEGPVLIVAHGGTYWSVEQHARVALNADAPNCTPLFHEPPSAHHRHWSVREM